MGEIVIVWYLSLSLFALSLILIGKWKKQSLLVSIGISLIASLCSLWILGPIGLFLGLFVFLVCAKKLFLARR